MKTIAGLAGLVGAMTMIPSTAHAVDFYNAATTTATVQTGVVHYLQIVNFAQGPGIYTLQSFQLGLNYNPATTNQGVIVQFYTGGDTSNAATDVLASATYVSGVSGTLAAPGTAGNYTYTFTLNTPITLTGSSYLVEFELTDATFSTYSTALSGRTTASAPTVGTAPGYVWNDANLDNVFTGAEKTTFGAAAAQVRFSASGTFASAVPEPATWGMMILGFAMVGGAMRNRRRETTVRFA